ncbi:MAG: nucleotidyltransferase family protein [Synergistaceae bacterium]|nr:nucleotidyltransferase family protein [Synergistaceae bacterium]
MISETNKATLALLASVLHGKTPEKISLELWHDVLHELMAQAVVALPAPYISALALPADAQQAYKSQVCLNLMNFHLLMQEQEKVISLLSEANIPVVVLKGSSAAVNYPVPEYRAMGDIDILVPPEYFRSAYETLVEAGYKTEESRDVFYRHVGFITPENIHLELHNYFSSSDNKEQNTTLDKMLFAGIANRRVQVQVANYNVAMLPIKENGLVLLGHINQHLSDGLGLRQIIDWMCYVERYLDDEFWEREFAEVAEKIGMKQLAIITTAMCQKYLGLKKDIHWCPYEPACDELMEYILSQGNFGQKAIASEAERAKATVASRLKKFRNPLRGLATAQRYGCLNWKACQKHRCLRPFAWLYQLIRWARRAREEKVGMKMFFGANAKAREETQKLKKFYITRM